MRKSKRVLFKPKVCGFNPYADQVPAIKQIMEETAQESEAPVLRMLIDEALRARRRKAAGLESPEQSKPAQEITESLETIQALLLKLIRQEETGFRIGSMNLELLQEALAGGSRRKNRPVRGPGKAVAKGKRLEHSRDRQFVRGTDKGRPGLRLRARGRT